MSADSQIRRLFDHMFWADRRVLDRLGENPLPAGLRLFAHVLAAERVWLRRVEGVDTAGVEIWPALSAEECAELASQNRFEYARYLLSLSESELRRVVAYRNSQGVGFLTPVQEILTHVAMHGSYHRGQIALSLRSGGAEPVNTDYITFVREQGLEAIPPLGT
jgi:uncharacterized damage-inducible protein DinB